MEGNDTLFTVNYVIRIMYVDMCVGKEVNYLQGKCWEL